MAGGAGRLCVGLLSPPTVLPGGYQQHRCHVETEFSIHLGPWVHHRLSRVQILEYLNVQRSSCLFLYYKL